MSTHGMDAVGEGRGEASEPRLAVVVMSYRNEATILEAIDSVLLQDVPAEVVVAHSGGGATPAILARARPSIAVVSTEGRWFAGAARNAGVNATVAPYVAFLAADCYARPGWVRARLALHEAGAEAVSSTVVAQAPGHAPLASHLFQHSTRMGHLVPPSRHRHGLSYSRRTLLQLGGFDEEMREGEDVEFNLRLQRAGVEPAWAPDVITVHRYPTTMQALVHDQLRRGQRRARQRPTRSWRIRTVIEPGWFALSAAARATRPGSPVPRASVIRALPHLGVAAAAWSLGALQVALGTSDGARG